MNGIRIDRTEFKDGSRVHSDTLHRFYNDLADLERLRWLKHGIREGNGGSSRNVPNK
jgi:hypothetical protein